jgi:hypothetical protein
MVTAPSGWTYSSLNIDLSFVAEKKRGSGHLQTGTPALRHRGRLEASVCPRRGLGRHALRFP